MFGLIKLRPFNSLGNGAFRVLLNLTQQVSKGAGTRFRGSTFGGIDAKTFFEMSAKINPIATALEVEIDNETKIVIEQRNNDPFGVSKFREEQIKISEKKIVETAERDAIIKGLFLKTQRPRD